MSASINTPVIFIIFKRTDTTQKVFEAIREAKPKQLLIIADGPREQKIGEAEKCAATRKVVEAVDWDCQIFQNYSDVNLGCKQRVATGLNWAFSIVEEAIILEDDCLPHPTFFRYCEELLRKYRDDERVVTITGTNLLNEWKYQHQSYHFSYYFNCWGWATWKRVWQNYDVEMKLWAHPEIKARVKDVIADSKQYLNRKKFLDDAYNGKIDTWDYQFFFTCLINSGLSITPAINLVSNIGFSEEGSNTKLVHDQRANLPIQTMKFPLQTPPAVAVDREYDYKRYKKVWDNSISERIRRKFKRLTINYK